MQLRSHRRVLAFLAILVMAGTLQPPTALADRDRGRGGDRGGFGDRSDRGGRGGEFGRDRNGDRGGDRHGDRGDYGAPSLSLRAAVDMVLSRYGGQVVKAETQARDGQMFYLIRVLTPEGMLVRVRVDALSGRMD